MQLATNGERIAAVEPVVRPPVVLEITRNQAPPPFERAVPLLVAIAILGGVAVRIFAFARNPSLWVDEAMLALNVLGRSPAELLEPLNWNQGAPVGYLMLAKLSVAIFGGSEFALRLPSLVAGILGVGMFVPLAYRLLPVDAARLAAVLFAVAPYLIGYSAEFKQYELDATIAVGLLALAYPVWRNEAGKWRLIGFALGGATAVWFSHPSTFVLAGVGFAALADAAVRRDRAALLTRLAVVAAWLISFGTCYSLFLGKLGMNEYLMSYWNGKFLPLELRPGTAAWIVHHFLEFFEKPGGMAATMIAASGLAGVLYLHGAMAMARADWRLLVALVTPLILAMMASALKKYPFAGRLLLFAVPAALMLIAYGSTVVAPAISRVIPGGGGLLVFAVLLGPVMHTHWLTKAPLHAEETREVIAHVRDHWQPGDRAYVFWAAVPALKYYTADSPFPDDAIRLGVEQRNRDPRLLHGDLDALRGHSRVWVVIAHRHPQEEAAIQGYLDAIGVCEETLRKSDAVVFRYDLSRSSVPLR